MKDKTNTFSQNQIMAFLCEYEHLYLFILHPRLELDEQTEKVCTHIS